MCDAVVMQNDLSRFGLRRVHVAQMGRRVDRRIWISKVVPAEVGQRDLDMHAYHEEELDIWHLWLTWHARDFVAPNAVWWWLEDMPVRLGVDVAATLYRRRFGQWPGRALIRSKPKGATETVRVSDGGERCVLPLMTMVWVPKRFVIVQGEIS